MNPNPRPTHRVIIVTGASSGIGRATAIELAAPDVRLSLVARRSELLDEVATLCRARGAECLVIPEDVSDPLAGRRVADQTHAAFGRIDVLVNAAGFAILGALQDADEGDLRRMMDTNYFGTVGCTLAVVPTMIEQKSGTIVNVGSITGIMGVARLGGYSATKFAITGFTESLRNDLLDHGIRVSLICPGTTRTAFFESAEESLLPGADRLNPRLTAEQVARAIRRTIRRGTPRVILPWTGLLFMRFKEIFPRSAHFLMRTTSKLIERKPQ